MSDYGAFTEPGTIRFERYLPGPIERVWSYLTESEKRGKWLASGEMEPRVGGRVVLNFRHADLSPHAEEPPEKYKYMEKGTGFTGRVTRYEPPHLLSYTWGDETGKVSEVTFELTPKGEKVLLVLTHRRLGDNFDTLASVAAGWHTHLGILGDRLDGRVPKGFWSVHTRMEQEYTNRLVL